MGADRVVPALVKKGAQVSETIVTDVPAPVPGPREVLLEIHGCGLCGSDVHAWRGDEGYEWVKPPVVVGHEAVGLVTAIGSEVPAEIEGVLAVPISIDGCGQCMLCRAGDRQICGERTVLGLSFDGAATKRLRIDHERLVLVPEGVSPERAVLTEPLSVAIHAVDLLGELPADAVVGVSGPGPVGILAAWTLMRRGVEVFLTGVDRDETMRLPAARALGLRTTTSAKRERATHWIEASGAGVALNSALAALPPFGSVVVVALYGRIPEVDINLLVRNQIIVTGSYASTRSDYEEALRLLGDGQELVTHLVTTFTLKEAVGALQATAEGTVGKAVIQP